MNDSCFMEPMLKMSAISTHRDLTEAFVEPMVSGFVLTQLLWKVGCEAKVTSHYAYWWAYSEFRNRRLSISIRFSE